MELSTIASRPHPTAGSWRHAGSDLLLAALRNRLVLAGVAIVLAGTGLTLRWSWLTAIGIAPLILSIAPCLIMCALGVCMMARGQQACSAQPAAGTDKPANTQSGSEA